MAANDPSFDVPTPRGVLRGVAVFNWDGAQWQPQGKAATEVATPTGVLRGVAAFSGGTPWAPAGRAQTEVPTPSGVLDGVAVYTWSGSQWTPPSGNIETATPSGVLEGVAAFDWDGTTWQPAAQAGAEVPTPYGVLTGVARFGWTGSAWAAVGAPSLSLDFMTPGALDGRITFTRASTATYTDASGVIQTAAVNQPRWDYAGGSLRGLLIEEARTNLVTRSGDLADPVWGLFNATSALPVVTANNVVSPDGTTTGARVVLPAVSAAGAYSLILQSITGSAAPYVFSLWLRGAAGGEQTYLIAAAGGGLYFRSRLTLTTQWQRFTLVMSALTAAPWSFMLGTDLRDASQTSTSAQTIYAWGAQAEPGAFVTSYIPTAGVSVARARDSCTVSSANMSPWFAPPGGSWLVEFIGLTPIAGGTLRVVGDLSAPSGDTPMFVGSSGQLAQYDVASFVQTVNFTSPNMLSKGATTWATGSAKACANGGAVATTAAMTTGYGVLAANGISLLSTATAPEFLSGYIRRVQYWPRALSATEMQQVTT